MTVSGPTNASGVLLASAVRAATATTDPQQNQDARGILMYLNFTVQAGAETLTPEIQGYDPGSDTWATIHTAYTALSATGTYLLALFPAALSQVPATTGQGKNMVLPRTWRVVVTHSSTGNHTYSLSYSLIA
jgi:hypothetical protein